MSKYVASIDQGTTSSRCIVFNSHGKIVAQAQKEHRQIYPSPGWVEHDPEEIWSSTLQVFHEALNSSNLRFSDLAAVGITNQRETSVFWNRKTGKPYLNAIVWQDTRSSEVCDRLSTQGGQDRFRGSTGLPLATYFSGPKIVWALEHVPGLLEDAVNGDALFGNIDTWLIWNLTGGVKGGIHVTDVTNASRTMLMNLGTLDWDSHIITEMGIPSSMLPRIQASSSLFGYADPLGGIPIASDLGDQQAALFGQVSFNPGEAKNTYGTGCFMLLNTGAQIVPSMSGLLTTVGYQIGDQPAVFCLEGSIAITGALVQWLRDNLGIIQNSNDIEPLANTVEDNGGIYFVPAFSGLYAPYWRSDARGAILGMTRFINRGHIARAVLEATAFQTREVLEAMELDSGVKLSSLKVDGGMVGNDLLMQFQADILNVPVVRPSVTETTALGAAYAAGLAVGYWPDLDDLRDKWTAGREWRPQMNMDRRDALFRTWKKAVTKTFNWIE
jgi:glycerol kinase